MRSVSRNPVGAKLICSQCWGVLDFNFRRGERNCERWYPERELTTEGMTSNRNSELLSSSVVVIGFSI